MLVLGINAVGTRHSGAATVLLDLIEGLLLIQPPIEIVAFLSPAAVRDFELPTSDRLRIVEAPTSTNNPLLRYWWLNRGLRESVCEARCDVLINMNNLAGRSCVPQVLFLQQSKYLSAEARRSYGWKHMGARRWIEPILMSAMIRRSIATCDRVVVQTSVMKSTVEAWLGSRVSVKVIPPIAPDVKGRRNEEVPPLRSSCITYLYVGNASPYKNLGVILLAASLSAERRKLWRFRLTIPTPRAGEGDHIEFIGRIDRLRLAREYAACHALIMPSLVETVGLPMLEAMTFGIPIVAADRPYAREICGDAAKYFDPASPESLFAALQELENPQEWQRLSEAGKQQIRLLPDRVTHAELWLGELFAITSKLDYE